MENKKRPETDWHSKKDSRRHQKSTYGYSVHRGADEDRLIHSQSATPCNTHDNQEPDVLISGDKAKLYADAAYSSKRTREKLDELDIEDQVQLKGYRNNPLTKQDKIRNAENFSNENGWRTFFAIYEQHYGLARTRFIGLSINETFYGLTAMPDNIKKGKILMLYGLPDITIAG